MLWTGITPPPLTFRVRRAPTCLGTLTSPIRIGLCSRAAAARIRTPSSADRPTRSRWWRVTALGMETTTSSATSWFGIRKVPAPRSFGMWWRRHRPSPLPRTIPISGRIPPSTGGITIAIPASHKSNTCWWM